MTKTISFQNYPGVTPVAKDVERSGTRIIAKAGAHQAIKTIEAFAHIAAINRQKDFQAPAEADHCVPTGFHQRIFPFSMKTPPFKPVGKLLGFGSGSTTERGEKVLTFFALFPKREIAAVKA